MKPQAAVPAIINSNRKIADNPSRASKMPDPGSPMGTGRAAGAAPPIRNPATSTTPAAQSAIAAQ